MTKKTIIKTRNEYLPLSDTQSLGDVIDHFQRLANDYGYEAMISIPVERDVAQIEFTVQETEEEKEIRLDMEQRIKDRTDQRDKDLFTALKEKFEPNGARKFMSKDSLKVVAKKNKATKKTKKR